MYIRPFVVIQGQPAFEIYTPIFQRDEEKLLGALDMAADSSRAFSQADVDLLSLLATQAVIAIMIAQLCEQARPDAETKPALLHEVNHRVKNNLAGVIGLLYATRCRPGREWGIISRQ